MTLAKFFKEHPKVALGFSGGVDSSYLLYAAKQYGADVQPYYIKTAFQPQFEYDDVMRLAGELQIPVTVIEVDILSSDAVRANPSDRCYFCKTQLFTTLRDRAIADGYSVLIDGTNASDDAADRAGMKAIRELSVKSPLQACGITKPEVRRLSKEAGLFTWDKPAYACLATRIPTGDMITADMLRRIEQSEDALFQLGYTDFRVRIFNNAARLHFPKAQMLRAVEQTNDILAALKPQFDIVLMDMEGR